MMTLRPTKDVMKSEIFYLSNSLRGVREALAKSFVEITIIYEIKKELQAFAWSSFCDSAGIQTRNLLIRSQMLYSVELRSQTLIVC